MTVGTEEATYGIAPLGVPFRGAMRVWEAAELEVRVAELVSCVPPLDEELCGGEQWVCRDGL